MAATLQSKLRGMGRLTSLTFASSLGFDEVGFVLGDKKRKKVKAERRRQARGGRGKKEGDREGQRQGREAGRQRDNLPSTHEIP